jgi:hypothetical protein
MGSISCFNHSQLVVSDLCDPGETELSETGSAGAAHQWPGATVAQYQVAMGGEFWWWETNSSASCCGTTRRRSSLSPFSAGFGRVA